MNNIQLLNSLIKKVFKTVPLYTINSIITSLLNKILTMAIFLLPLKIVFMLNIDTIPSYFPDFMESFSKNQLIYFLTFCSIFSFFLFLTMNSINQRIIKIASDIIIKSTNKIILFSNQDDIAKQAYKNVSTVFSSIIFVTVLILTLNYIYVDVLIVNIYYIVSILVLSFFILRFKNLKYLLEQNINMYLTIIDAIGFLISFIFIIFMSINKTDNNLLIIIISLMIVRLIFGNLKEMTISIYMIIRDKNKISAVFLDKHIFVDNVTDDKENFWTKLERKNIKSIFFKLMKTDESDITIVWKETGIANIVTYEINYYNKHKDVLEIYLLKVYNKTQIMHAMHEATLLLSDTATFLETLKLKFIDNFNGYHCHLFSLDFNANKIEQLNFREAYESIYEKLLITRPEQVLVDIYCSTKPLIWKRLESYSLINRLRLFINTDEEESQLNDFKNYLSSIYDILLKLPLQIVNQNITYENIYETDTGYTFVNWLNWSIDPIGARWPSDNKGIKKLETVINNLNSNKIFEKNIDINHVLISMYAYELDRFFIRNNYGQVLTYVNKIIEVFNKNTYLILPKEK